jgi:hypothetical protein
MLTEYVGPGALAKPEPTYPTASRRSGALPRHFGPSGVTRLSWRVLKSSASTRGGARARHAGRYRYWGRALRSRQAMGIGVKAEVRARHHTDVMPPERTTLPVDDIREPSERIRASCACPRAWHFPTARRTFRRPGAVQPSTITALAQTSCSGSRSLISDAGRSNACTRRSADSAALYDDQSILAITRCAKASVARKGAGSCCLESTRRPVR